MEQQPMEEAPHSVSISTGPPGGGKYLFTCMANSLDLYTYVMHGICIYLLIILSYIISWFQFFF